MFDHWPICARQNFCKMNGSLNNLNLISLHKFLHHNLLFNWHHTALRWEFLRASHRGVWFNGRSLGTWSGLFSSSRVFILLSTAFALVTRAQSYLRPITVSLQATVSIRYICLRVSFRTSSSASTNAENIRCGNAAISILTFELQQSRQLPNPFHGRRAPKGSSSLEMKEIDACCFFTAPIRACLSSSLKLWRRVQLQAYSEVLGLMNVFRGCYGYSCYLSLRCSRWTERTRDTWPRCSPGIDITARVDSSFCDEMKMKLKNE